MYLHVWISNTPAYISIYRSTFNNDVYHTSIWISSLNISLYSCLPIDVFGMFCFCLTNPIHRNNQDHRLWFLAPTTIASTTRLHLQRGEQPNPSPKKVLSWRLWRVLFSWISCNHVAPTMANYYSRQPIKAFHRAMCQRDSEDICQLGWWNHVKFSYQTIENSAAPLEHEVASTLLHHSSNDLLTCHSCRTSHKAGDFMRVQPQEKHINSNHRR